MNALLLHPVTRTALERLAEMQPHAILLTGEPGAGKHSVARELASKLVEQDLSHAPFFKTILPDGKATSIEQIRDLHGFLQLKTIGQQKIRRVVILVDADTMTTEAQNALLKVLEEPPQDTVIILTASRPQLLKPTIHSRVQTVSLLPVTKPNAIAYFENRGYKSSDINRAYMLADGQPALLTQLLEEVESSLVQSIDRAKAIYGMSAYERLHLVEELSKDKEQVESLLYACKRICAAAVEQAAVNGQSGRAAKWHEQLRLISQAEDMFQRSANVKLLLTNLFVSM